jgi:CBS domain-containing protein
VEDKMKVKNAMHKPVRCVDLETPIRMVAKRMRTADIGAIPVQHNGTLVGIITDRDIACRAVGNGADLDTLHARDVMTTNVTTCAAEDDLVTAVARMKKKHIRRLPVVDQGNSVVGILSLGDISHKVSSDVSGQVLRSVSAHHA